MVAAPVSLEPGRLIAQKYALLRSRGRGGMGEVWVARHVELDTEVALKFSRVDEDFDSQGEQRFRREAQAAARLKSPHIVQIHDFGVYEGRPYIAMELLHGEDLSAVLERVGRVSVAQARAWLGQAAKALRVVHAAGIVHRDIKPSNLFLVEEHGDPVVKMLDFGVAKTPRDGAHTTSAGVLLGSPAYMSPEQARGNPVDARSDLWSLSAVFYRMLTGVAPFEGSSPGDVLVRVCTEDVAPPSQHVSALGEDVDRFFRRALARDPARRFASVEEWLDAAQALPDDAEFSTSGGAACSGSACRGSASSAAPGSAPGRSTPTASLRVPAAGVEPTQASPIHGAEQGDAEQSDAQRQQVERGEGHQRRTFSRRTLWWSGAGVLVAGLVFTLRPGSPPFDSRQSALQPEAPSLTNARAENASEAGAPSPPVSEVWSDTLQTAQAPALPATTSEQTEASEPTKASEPKLSEHEKAPARKPTSEPGKAFVPKTSSTSGRSTGPSAPKPAAPPTAPRPADPVFGLPLPEGP